MLLKVDKSVSLEDIIRGCRRRRSKAQTELYNRYAGRFLAVCRRYIGNREEAEDVLNKGFMKIFDKIFQYREEGSFEAWMTRIMVNESLSYIRQNKNMSVHVGIEHADREPDYSLAESILNAQQILEIVDELPVGYRTVFNLYVMEGYSHKEISIMLNISEGASKSQLSRAKAQLKGKIISLEERIKKKDHGK